MEYRLYIDESEEFVKPFVKNIDWPKGETITQWFIMTEDVSTGEYWYQSGPYNSKEEAEEKLEELVEPEPEIDY